MGQNLHGKPGQWLLIRDPYLDGGSDTVSASSEYAPRVGITVVSDANQGALIPTVMGAPEPDDDTSSPQTFRIVRGGGVGSAEFAYQVTDDEPFRGYSSEFYTWGAHKPGTASAKGSVPLYSRAYRRMLFAYAITTGAAGTGSIHVRYLDANERPQTFWATPDVPATLVILSPPGGVSAEGHPLCGCELRDGTLLLGVRRFRPGLASNVTEQGDWDLYRSTDGGASWNLAIERVHETYGTASTVLMFEGAARMASSGDWVRWCFVRGDGGIVTLSSSDGGATWTKLEDIEVDDGADGTEMLADPILLTDQLFDRQPFDIIGVDDGTGTFLLAAQAGEDIEFVGEGAMVALWFATRNEPWSYGNNMPGEPDDTDPTIVNPIAGDWDRSQAFCFIRDPYWLTLWVYRRTGVYGAEITDAGWNVYRAPREQVLQAAGWERRTDTSRMRGAWRGIPCSVRGVWAGDRGAMAFDVLDGETDPQPHMTQGDQTTLCWVSGWSSHPVGSELHLADDVFEVARWDYHHGEPAGGATSGTGTDWTSASAGGGASSYTASSVGLRLHSASATDRKTYSLKVSPNDNATPTEWDCSLAEEPLFIDGKTSVYEWCMAVGLTQSTPNARTQMRISMPSRVLASGFGWRLAVEHRAGSVIVKDDVGSTVLATLTDGAMNLRTGEDEIFHRLRLAIAPSSTSSTPTGMVLYRRDDGDRWFESDPFSLPSATSAGITMIQYEWGEFPASAGGAQYSWWRDFRSFAARFRIPYPAWSSPQDLIGARCSIRPRALGAGATSLDAHRLQTAWGGGGAVEEDQFTSEVDHEGAAEQCLMDSPQLRWQSTAGATAGAYLIFDAASESTDEPGDNGQRFVHNALALFGLSNPTVVVDYADDAAFSTNVTPAGTISAVSFAGMRVTSVNGSHVVLAGATNVRRGELSGKYLVVTAGATGGQQGHVHRIARHVYDGAAHHLHLDMSDAQFDPTVSLSAGTSVSAFSDRAWITYASTISRRYLRLRFGATGENNWSGRWALGTPVGGIALELGRAGEPVLDWSSNDEERPNLTTFRTRRGITWARPEGDPDRTITGRLAGDVTGFRYEFRDQIRHIAQYQVQPMALLLNDEALSGQDESLHLVRFDGPTGLDNQAYTRQDSTGPIRRVGDLQVQFKIIV